MGNAISIGNEHIQPLLDKIKNLVVANDLITLGNANTRKIVATLLITYGAYVTGRFILKCYRIHQIRKKLEGVPNKPRVLTGNLYDSPGPGPGMFPYFQNKVNLYKKMYQSWLGPFYPRVTLCHPETAKILLKSSEPKFLPNEMSAYTALQDWLGDGLLLSSGSKWFRNRRLLTPAFHFEILKPYLDVYQVAAEKFINKMATFGENGSKSVPIYAFVSFMTLDIILRCAFSYEGDIQSQGKSDPYVTAVSSMTDLAIQRLYKPLLHNPIMFYLSPTGRKFRKSLNYIHKVAEDVIQRRKKTLAENPDAPKKRFLDFLDILLVAQDDEGKGLTEKEIKDEVNTFLFEGHDTTASGISWVLYELARHPEIQEQVREEVVAVLGTDRNAVMEWTDLSRLPFLTQCIKETMRIHPPVPIIPRQLTQDLEIGGHIIPKNTNLDVSIYGLHHNPEVWGEDHMEFKPERFHPDNIKNKDAYDYIPFSAGPRNCIGQNFALNEEKTVIAKVLQTFEIRVDPTHKVASHPEGVTRPTYDIKLYFRPCQ